MKTNKAIVISILSTTLLIGGCASNLQGDSYSREDARQVQTVKYGTIEDVRLVVIEGTKTPIGTAAGATGRTWWGVHPGRGLRDDAQKASI